MAGNVLRAKHASAAIAIAFEPLWTEAAALAGLYATLFEDFMMSAHTNRHMSRPFQRWLSARGFSLQKTKAFSHDAFAHRRSKKYLYIYL
jgi:hypothetical protein